MAGMLGGTTGAAITAIVMVFELTRDYNVIVPMILGVTLALAVRRAVLPESVYTLKLVKKGHEVPDALQANTYRIRHAERAMSTDFEVRPATAPLDEVIASLVGDRAAALSHGRRAAPRSRAICGSTPASSCGRRASPGMTLGDLARTDFVLARPADTMFDVIGRLARRGGAGDRRARRRRIPRVDDVAGYDRARDHGRRRHRERAGLCRAADAQSRSRILYRRRVVRPIRFWREKLRGSRTERET